MEELEKVPKELKGSATLQVEQQYVLTNTLPQLLSLAAYVAEDSLVGHQWKERPMGLANFLCLSTGECQGQELGVGGQGSGREGMGDIWDSIGNVNEENT